MSIIKHKYIIISMSVREDIKILLIQERMTLTELAEERVTKTGKKYTLQGLSQKLQRSSMKYDEVKEIAKILGYNLKFEKINVD